MSFFFIVIYSLCTILTFDRRLFSFPSEDTTWYTRFNRSGTRLLCHEKELVVYDLPTLRQLSATRRKIKLTGPDFNIKQIGGDANCFAGINDELIIGSSGINNNLYIWSMANMRPGVDCQLSEPLLVLPGHEDKVNCIRYNSDTSAIISSDDDGVIKLWTSTRSR